MVYLLNELIFIMWCTNIWVIAFRKLVYWINPFNIFIIGGLRSKGSGEIHKVQTVVQFKKFRHQNWNEMYAAYWGAGAIPGVFSSTILRILRPGPLMDHIQSYCRKVGHESVCNRDALHPNGCGVGALSNCARTMNWITQPRAPTLLSWKHLPGLRPSTMAVSQAAMKIILSAGFHRAFLINSTSLLASGVMDSVGCGL